MICNIASPPCCTVLKTLHRAELLIEMDILSVANFTKQETTVSVSIRHFLQTVVEYTKHMSIDACH
jgi:alpha-D-ribose 1-methylphosphonate 5-phosphate C-P lyase